MTQLYDTPDLPANNNGHRVRHRLRTDDDTTGLDAAATGLSLSGFLAATRDGGALAGTSITLTEYAGAPGVYSGVIPGATLQALLATYADHTVWEVVTSGTDYRAERPYTLRAARLPGNV